MGDGSSWIAEMQESTREEPGNVIRIESTGERYTEAGRRAAAIAHCERVIEHAQNLLELLRGVKDGGDTRT